MRPNVVPTFKAFADDNFESNAKCAYACVKTCISILRRFNKKSIFYCQLNLFSVSAAVLRISAILGNLYSSVKSIKVPTHLAD